MKDYAAVSATHRLALRYGLMMTAALVGFFFLMKVFGLAHNLELRALNIVILSGFIYLALNTFKKRRNGQLPYFSGLRLGIFTALAGVIPFALLVFIYITVISPEFMADIVRTEPFGELLNPVIVTFTIILEGMISGFLVSYVAMQYLRPDHMLQRAEVMEYE